MELMLLRIFQAQVALQCQAVILAAQDLQRAMMIDASPWTWVAIQNLLSAAANASKALWGQGSRFAAEREDLRVSLGVDDTSPLKLVSMRNHFEHYDERLDKWWAESTSHNYFDMSVMPTSFVQGLADTDMFRVFDPNTAELVFWGERFNIQQIVSEAERLLPIANAEARKPHWEPPSTSGSGQ